MTDQERRSGAVIDAETKAEIKILVQGRKEDREMFHQLSEKVEKMADSVTSMVIAITEQTKDNERLTERVQEVEDKIKGEDGLDKRMRNLEKEQTGDTVRWKIVAAGVGGIAAISAAFVSVIASFLQPVANILERIFELLNSL